MPGSIMKTLIHALIIFWILLLIGDYIVTRKAFVDPPRTTPPVFEDAR